MTNEEDEIIDVRLPRKDYELLREVLQRESALTWFKSTIRSYWAWALVGGIIAVWNLWDKIIGAIK